MTAGSVADLGRHPVDGALLLVAAVLAGAAAVTAARRRWRAARVAAPGRHRRPSGSDRGWPRAHPGAAAAAGLGRLEQGLGRAARTAARRPADADRDRQLGRGLLVGVAVVVVGGGPLLAAAVGAAVVGAPALHRARRRRQRRWAVQDEAPEVVELVRLAVASGLNVRLALEAVLAHHHGVVTSVLASALDRADRGERLADALDHLLGGSDPPVALGPLVDALVATERYGAPLLDALDRVAADARTARRRRREEAARRVPVKLLFPLVFCTLPAFALLTVVPVLMRALPELSP